MGLFSWLKGKDNKCSCGCEEEYGEFDFEGHPYSVIVDNRYYLADRYALIHGPEMSVEGIFVEIDLEDGKIDARKFYHWQLEIVFNPSYNFNINGTIDENNIDVV